MAAPDGDAGQPRVLVTVGSTSFDELIALLTSPPLLTVLRDRGYRCVRLQIGRGTYEPPRGRCAGVQLEWFRYKPSLAADLADAALVLSHAGASPPPPAAARPTRAPAHRAAARYGPGAGTVLEVLRARRPLVVVTNDALMDNHQRELAEQLAADGHLYHATCRTLAATLASADFTRLTDLPRGDPARFAAMLNEEMGFGR